MKKISRAVKIGLIELTSFLSHSEMKEMESRFLLNNPLQIESAWGGHDFAGFNYYVGSYTVNYC